ncbi:antibiotic biosynthesis monooxygenase [Streptomyces sp. V2]|uniref:Antibiotic biosynthesis monooxygenase family protein n=1 Tax=Streptomyces niveiscabiei TaxID=164115 RepID=A0ABW9HHQ5_9ACTN|nr:MULTISPECIES: antibiotic biosynthesis monooxygenase family protein [Streptomyces]PWG11817.1 antibiotic biosynthesis monooxygenase [Streptomyces sp. V2]QZZ25106.1 antibiotic biosynthesis monooxygenase [Streptomyces sp. ST1015]
MIVMINRFTLRPGTTAERFEALFDQVSDLALDHPGYIDHTFVRDQDDPSRYLNVARWESVEHYREFMKMDAHTAFYPEILAITEVSPALYELQLEFDASAA